MKWKWQMALGNGFVVNWWCWFWEGPRLAYAAELPLFEPPPATSSRTASAFYLVRRAV